MRPERWLHTIPLRLRALFRRAEADQELDDELRDHLERKTEEYVAQRMTPEEAYRRAHLDRGGIEQTKEKCRDARRITWLQEVGHEIRYGLRTLRKSPGFTAVVVITLALGVGANTAIFALVDAVMLRSLPVQNPAQLVVLQWTARRHFMNGHYSSFSDCGETGLRPSTGCSFPLPFFDQIRSHDELFSGALACAGPADLDLTGTGPARTVRGEIVSGDYFSTLGVNTIIGRAIGLSDDSPTASPVAVLSYSYWQDAFGGSRSVLGRAIVLNGVPFTIIGVAQASFTKLSPGKTQDLWLPIAMVPRLRISWASEMEGFTNWWLLIIARLKPGVSLNQAQAAASLAFSNEVLYGPMPLTKASDNPGIVLTRAQEGLVGRRGELSKTLYLLMSAVGLILLITCANIAGLLLSRAAKRHKEIAIRFSLGGSRARIMRQLLIESMLLSLAGGTLGIVFAYWGVHALTAVTTGGSDTRFPYLIGADWRVLSFTLGVCIVTGIVFGLAPAVHATCVDLGPALKEFLSPVVGTRTNSRRWVGLGDSLVIAQSALSVIVLVGAGLLMRTVENLRNVNPGFDTRNMLVFKITPGEMGYQKVQAENLFGELRDRLAALPGVTSVSCSSVALLTGGHWFQSVHVEGQPQNSNSVVNMFGAGSEFFRTMRIPLLEGRWFPPENFERTHEEAPIASANSSSQPTATIPPTVGQAAGATADVLVNEAFVHQYFGNQNPLGKLISNRHWSSAAGGAWDVTPKPSEWRIVGVVGNTKYDSLRKEVQPVIYVPFTGARGGFFELRTATDPRALIPAVRAVAEKLDSNLPLSDVRTQMEHIEGMMGQERLTARVAGFFGVLALTLACMGLYGLLAYEVSRRARDIGIRIALGAQRGDVMRLVIGQGALLAGIGIAIGVAVAFGLTRLMTSLLFGVTPTDSATFTGAAILFQIVGLAACYVPARRAMQVDPMVALRYE